MSDSKFQRFSDRFFQVSPLYTSPGWYSLLRGGSIVGPFPTKEAGQTALFDLFGITADTSEMILQQVAPVTRLYSEDTRST